MTISGEKTDEMKPPPTTPPPPLPSLLPPTLTMTTSEEKADEMAPLLPLLLFSVRFGRNLVWGLIVAQKQHIMSLKCLRPFFDLLA